MDSIVRIEHLTHRYDRHIALDDLSLEIRPGELFGFLGPNGSGKTTLFRILSTLIAPTEGSVEMIDLDLATSRPAIREQIGVVFQSPSLDKQLSAEENLRHHGHLYGLSGKPLTERIDHLLERFGLSDRRHERVHRFSGGMRRRVELAKGLLNRPRLLLLDEPSTGLDPGARIDLWRHLRDIQQHDHATILLTTHLMDEADRCTRLAILDQGKLIACNTPAALKERIGGDIISLTTSDPTTVRTSLKEKLGLDSEEHAGTIRLERPRGHEVVPQLIESMPGLIDSVSVGKPTLEDVFVHLTGRGLRSE